jgi:hypothetical protein
MIKYMEKIYTKGIKRTFEGREYTYKGEINEKNEPHGQGMLKTKEDVMHFKGFWKNGKPVGFWTCKPNGILYKGTWKQGIFIKN